MLAPRFLAVCVLCCGVCCAPADGQDDSGSGAAFFAAKVRPLFAEHCYRCHGPENQESDLRLDTYEGLSDGGVSGDAVVPGEPTQSMIVVAIGYGEEDLQMPPDGKLSDEQIAVIVDWIEQGAPHPDAPLTKPPRAAEAKAVEETHFWSFQPPTAPPIPSVSDRSWIKTPVDSFVLKELDRHGLVPTPPADRRTLLRRVTFDLLGLPPTPSELTSFLADDEPGAFQRVVDRLLASPRYGERWGRHWLDVARYADSNGLDENIAHGNAWRYRDYVIASINADKSYDQFLLEQIAGDLLSSSEHKLRSEQLLATGFLSLGPKVLAEGDQLKMEMDIIDEQIDTLGRAVLGMTLGCARCHDHKFDPISTEDYYALAGIFKSTRTMESFKRIARWNENSIATRKQLAAKTAHEAKVAEQKQAIQSIVEQANQSLKKSLPKGSSLPADVEARYPEDVRSSLEGLRQQLAELEKRAPLVPTAMGVQEGDVADLSVHIRGNHLNLGNLVPRGVPVVMSRLAQPSFDAASSGRLELARWLVDPEHPLVARVMVNRVWRWHFGRGLVASPDNFGNLGERPANQPLLDWLARCFTDSGWSIKSLHRLILLSATYQMGSQHSDQGLQLDPENVWQWRTSVRRLEAEAMRDALLAVGGLLDNSMGGSMLHVDNREFFFDHTSKDETNYDSLRRSVYLPVVRNHLYDVFSLFDYTDASVPNGDRAVSTVAPQALFMMNSDLVAQAAEAVAEELLQDRSRDDDARIQQLFLRLYGRPPSAGEVARCRSYLRVFAAELDRVADQETQLRSIWTALAHVLLAANEFIHVR